MSSITRPPAVPSNMSEQDRAELQIVEKYAAADRYISADEIAWFPFGDTFEMKLYRMDNRNGDYVICLRTEVGGVVGKHRHRGPVNAHTIKGAWGYFEYDWVARPGDFVRENPGTVHTLFMEPDSEAMYMVNGAIDFLNDDETLLMTMDGWSFVHAYSAHCDAVGAEFNDRIFY